MIEYTLIRSQRKTLALQITRDLQVLVRAPQRLGQADIDRFVEQHRDWIAKNLEKQWQRLSARPELGEDDIAELKRQAREYIPPRVQYYAGIMGLEPSSIKITSAQSRFGSCSSGNGLCFSYRLMLYPLSAIDYVVVHELAHIAHKNHGPDFYQCIAAILPDYRRRQALLKDG